MREDRLLIDEISSIGDARRVRDTSGKAASIQASTRNRGEFPFGIWFRGRSDVKHRLEPQVFRPRTVRVLEGGEDRSRLPEETNGFIRSRVRLGSLRDGVQLTLDWLCLGRHDNDPTCLLDRIERLLVRSSTK